jgi:hypothetical protein
VLHLQLNIFRFGAFLTFKNGFAEIGFWFLKIKIYYICWFLSEKNLKQLFWTKQSKTKQKLRANNLPSHTLCKWQLPEDMAV